MADTTVTCPCCDEELKLFKCQKCKGPAVRTEEEECSECSKDFCPECINDHDCDGEPEEENDEDEG